MTNERRQQRPPPTGPAVDDEDPDRSPMDREREKTLRRDTPDDEEHGDDRDRRQRRD